MKRIILVRHAKSSWKFDVIDHERPLNERGLNDAEMISKHLVSHDNLNIDFVMSSDAVRAKTTAHIFTSNLKIEEEKIEFIHNLYDFQGDNLIKIVKNCKDSVSDLMLFGHNHAITHFVNTYGNQFIENVPTSGVTIIEFNINRWKDLNPGHTIKTLFPRDIK